MTGQKNGTSPVSDESIYRKGSDEHTGFGFKNSYDLKSIGVEMRSLGICERDAVPMAGGLNLASETTLKKRTDASVRSDTCTFSIFTEVVGRCYRD